MIDPHNITRYDRTEKELQELLLFCILVVNKDADRTAEKLESMLKYIHGGNNDCDHFSILRQLGWEDLLELITEFKFGNHTMKTKAVRAASLMTKSLSEVTVEDLESLHGIGKKTARFFLLHSRPGARVAVIDTHLYQFFRLLGLGLAYQLRDRDYDMLESTFLFMCDALGLDPAAADLRIWKYMRERKEIE